MRGAPLLRIPWSLPCIMLVLLSVLALCDGLHLEVRTATTVKGAYDTSNPYSTCITDPVYKASISNNNGNNIRHIFVTITEGLRPNDKLVMGGTIEFGAGISSQYDAETGEMVISGDMTVEKAEELISFLKYIPPKYEMTAAAVDRSRMIQIQVQDTSGQLSNAVSTPHLMETAMRVHTSCLPGRIIADFFEPHRST